MQEALWSGPRTADSWWWASPPLALLLVWLTSWPRLLFRKEPLIPSCFLTGCSACLTVERCKALWFCCISGHLRGHSSDHPACSCPLPLSSSSWFCVLLSSLLYPARHAVSLQWASILSVSVGWLHSRTRYTDEENKLGNQMLAGECHQYRALI